VIPQSFPISSSAPASLHGGNIAFPIQYDLDLSPNDPIENAGKGLGHPSRIASMPSIDAAPPRNRKMSGLFGARHTKKGDGHEKYKEKEEEVVVEEVEYKKLTRLRGNLWSELWYMIISSPTCFLFPFIPGELVQLISCSKQADH